MQWKRLLGVWAAGVVCLGGMALAQNGPGGVDQREDGYTSPPLWGRAEYRLKIADVVDSVPVKLGQRVKAGDVLLKEDTREEEAELAMNKFIADSDIDILIAKAKLEKAQKDLDRYEALRKGGNAAPAELESAKAEVKVGELEVQKAFIDQKAAKLKVARLEAAIAVKQIVSRFDGVVESIDIRPGEVVDPTKPAITVVNNSPLWVEFKPYSAVALQLKVGQELDVYYPGESAAHKAKIIFIDPVVDAKSDRELVRMEMANPEDRPSGLRVKIALPGSVVAEAKKE